MKISVIITLKKNVLDPQGLVIQKTLNGMGFNNVEKVRQGKFFEIDVIETDKKKAKVKVEGINAEVKLENKEIGISPGQACVFYSKNKIGDKVLGGGWIDSNYL